MQIVFFIVGLHSWYMCTCVIILIAISPVFVFPRFAIYHFVCYMLMIINTAEAKARDEANEKTAEGLSEDEVISPPYKKWQQNQIKCILCYSTCNINFFLSDYFLYFFSVNFLLSLNKFIKITQVE